MCRTIILFLCGCIMQYESYFSRISPIFTLQSPGTVVVSFRKSLLQFNRSIPNQVISGECIAIPNSYLKIPKTFKHSEHKFLLEHCVLSTICAGSGTVPCAAILEYNVWILPRKPFRIFQFLASNNSDLENLALNTRHHRHELDGRN